MLECVMNVSEGRDLGVIEALRRAAGSDLLDTHSDPHHHRSVLTLVGEEAPRRVARSTVDLLDLADHDGVHPRIGVVDVVPFVPLGDATFADAVAARNRFATWASSALGVPSFLYGEERTLPAIRRDAWGNLVPDTGEAAPHPSAGAMAVGARTLLVAYNLWLADADLDQARAIARAMRRPAVRTLGLQVGDEVQVSMNLVEPLEVGPAQVWDEVVAHERIDRAELVGLVPREVLARIEPNRWAQLDLSEERTIEHRLASRSTS